MRAYFDWRMRMRKSQALGSLLVALSLTATGCGSSEGPEKASEGPEKALGGPEKAFEKAANEQLDHQLDFIEIVDTYQSGDREKAQKSAAEFVDSFNEFQTEYVCKDERFPEDLTSLNFVIKLGILDKDDRKELEKTTKNALKDLEKYDDSDDEAYVKSKHEDFHELTGSDSVYMKKEDGDWKVCDNTLQPGNGLLQNRV